MCTWDLWLNYQVTKGQNKRFRLAKLLPLTRTIPNLVPLKNQVKLNKRKTKLKKMILHKTEVSRQLHLQSEHHPLPIPFLQSAKEWNADLGIVIWTVSKGAPIKPTGERDVAFYSVLSTNAWKQLEKPSQTVVLLVNQSIVRDTASSSEWQQRKELKY